MTYLPFEAHHIGDSNFMYQQWLIYPGLEFSGKPWPVHGGKPKTKVMLLAFSLLGLHTPSAKLHCCGTFSFLQITLRISQRCTRSPGHCLKTLYSTSFGSRAEDALANLITPSTSLSVGSLMLTGCWVWVGKLGLCSGQGLAPSCCHFSCYL